MLVRSIPAAPFVLEAQVNVAISIHWSALVRLQPSPAVQRYMLERMLDYSIDL